MANNKKNATLALPSFTEDFSEWFNRVIFDAEIIDYRYNLKGCGVWLGYGFKLRRYILQIIRDLLEETEVPHEEYLFPMLIPETQLAKEEETVKGFEDEVYWVTHGGLNKLDVKLALRPTSETVMYPMVSKWIRSHIDLPLKTYQIVNTFRYEGKNTRPLIRVREITTFKEAHTYHKDAETCKVQIQEAVQVYKDFFDRLGVPYLVSSRPEWDTFPGAKYTVAFDCIFPGNKHRALQIGTVHNLGTTFSETFDIKYEDEKGDHQFVHQTCYGISERGIASVIATHGDGTGLKLPPEVAPLQVVIVPIIFKTGKEAVMEACQNMYKELRSAGIRVKFDDRDLSTGKKYFHWEMRGVPIRMEIGPRDLEKGNVCLVRRDIVDKKERKMFIKKETAVSTIKELFPQIYNDLWCGAKEIQKGYTIKTNDLEDALNFVDDNKGVAEIPFCGSEECAKSIETRVDGLQFLGIPERYLGDLNETPEKESGIYCANCQKPVDKYWRIGRSY